MRIDTMLQPAFVILFPLLTIIYGESSVTKGNTALCELNSPCLKIDNLDNQNGEGEDSESHTAIDNSQSTLNSTNSGPTNHNLDNGSVKDTITNTDEEINSGQIQIDEKNDAGHEDLDLRRKRSSPTLMRLLRLTFVEPSNTVVEQNESTTVHTNTRQSIHHDPFKYEDRYEGFQDLLYQINGRLKKIDRKLSFLDLSERNKHGGFITIRIPVYLDRDRLRSKREVADTNIRAKLDDTKSVEKTLNNTLVDVPRRMNNTIYTSEPLNTSNVISKIYTALKDVQNKISAIKGVKDAFSSDEKFKVGYIVASLESLELTLKKLVKRINTRRRLSAANKLSDEVELSKNVVSNLMEYLRIHLPALNPREAP